MSSTWICRISRHISAAIMLLHCASALCAIGAASISGIKSESFDRDPNWDGFNNRQAPGKLPVVTQDFGYSQTHFAGNVGGELGGQIWRSTTPAWYAAKIPKLTLEESFSASGTLSITAPGSAAGIFFGWFNAVQPGGGRPVSSLGMDIDCEHSGGRLAVRMISSGNRSCGTFITPFIPGKYRPTPLKKGLRFDWKLSYDPKASGGNGAFQFVVRGDSDQHEGFEGKTFTVEVPAEIRQQGCVFDRFGLMNGGKGGGPMKIYFGNLNLDGQQMDLARESEWEAIGNRQIFADPQPAGFNNFGFSPDTSFAGGKPGEIGGVFWRKEKEFSFYGDRLGMLTLTNRLEAKGKLNLVIGAPDSGMYLGWYSSANRTNDPARAGNFLGVEITGPTRIGHYFAPVCSPKDGQAQRLKSGPVVVPGKVHEFKIVYDPAGGAGNGMMQVTLGSETINFMLKPAIKARGASFDRFGLCSAAPGGGLVKIYLDDLRYTAGP
jgi:hypothetical protein